MKFWRAVIYVYQLGQIYKSWFASLVYVHQFSDCLLYQLVRDICLKSSSVIVDISISPLSSFFYLYILRLVIKHINL